MDVLWTTGLGSCLVIVLGVAAVLAAIWRARRAPDRCECPPGKGRPCYWCSTRVGRQR